MTKAEELVSIGDRVLFDFDSSALSADAKSTLGARLHSLSRTLLYGLPSKAIVMSVVRVNTTSHLVTAVLRLRGTTLSLRALMKRASKRSPTVRNVRLLSVQTIQHGLRTVVRSASFANMFLKLKNPIREDRVFYCLIFDGLSL